ncbi:glycosyltransferase family 4 protein [Sphingopyxis indica]|uniref:glycosyltransferase family 4 protein n=1 Tax=Sphingopyxis indica TaxID=436663 RepID=UPI002939250B|nr:glycosyltransferase family 4 protein [Sphingopyxis indica]WOF44581.1 glycosyltransferase family 4 protein [Sphingopyxis indica]
MSVIILLANGSHAKGGIEKYAYYLIRQIESSHDDISVFEKISRYDLPGVLKHISTIPCLISYFFFFLYHRIDVVHINFAPRGSTFRKIPYVLVSKLKRAKIILHDHGGGYEEFYEKRSGIVKRLIKWLFLNADAFVILDEGRKNFITDQIGVPRNRVIAVGNGVPAAKELAHPDNPVPSICFMGRLTQLKGVPVLLDALGTLKKRGIEFKALLGGDGDIEGYRAVAKRLSVEDQVEFLGWLNVDDVQLAYRRSDIFVLPSLVENQPMAILEAMAHGLPVVASNVGAVPSQVIEGETGLIVHPGDALSLADALERLCRDPFLRLRMGAAGYSRWQQRFSIEATATRMIKLYRELVA